MKQDNRNEFEKKISNVRDQILLACMSGDVELARQKLTDARLFLDRASLSAATEKEIRCRLIESEIDIVERESDAKKRLRDVLTLVLSSNDFTELRRAEIVERIEIRIANFPDS